MAWITTPERTRYDWHEVPSDEVPSDREMKALLVSRLNENSSPDFDIRVDVSQARRAARRRVDSPSSAAPPTTPGTCPGSSAWTTGCRSPPGRSAALTGRPGVQPARSRDRRTHLDEVAQLVGDPRPAAASVQEGGGDRPPDRRTAPSRIVARQAAARPPRAQRAGRRRGGSCWSLPRRRRARRRRPVELDPASVEATWPHRGQVGSVKRSTPAWRRQRLGQGREGSRKPALAIADADAHGGVTATVAATVAGSEDPRRRGTQGAGLRPPAPEFARPRWWTRRSRSRPLAQRRCPTTPGVWNVVVNEAAPTEDVVRRVARERPRTRSSHRCAGGPEGARSMVAYLALSRPARRRLRSCHPSRNGTSPTKTAGDA